MNPNEMALPNFISIDSPSRTITIFTNNFGDAGTYQIEIKATFSNGQTASFTF